MSEKSANLARYRKVLRGSAALSVLMVAISFGGQAHAQNVWAGGDGIWTDASKWSFGIPAAGQTVNVGLPGTVLIDNAAAEAGRVRVGGGAHLNVLGGGTLTTTLLSSVGYGAFGPGAGTMLIDGAGSKWVAQSGVRVGEGTQGTLTVSNRGELDISGASLLSVGTGVGGNGVLNIDNGSVVNAAAALRLGYNGATGTVNITNGGKLSTSVTGATDNTIGDGSAGTAATGEVNISGAGSSWTIGPDGELQIGRQVGSEGTLNVRDGGKLTFQNDSTIYVGFQGGTGNVLVTGTGSTIDSSGGFAIANTAGSKGKVEVTNGGLIAADHGIVVGREAGAEAELTIATGGTVTAGTTANIAEVGAKGTVVVTGAGSKLEAVQSIAIGLDPGSEGKLTVANGATVKAPEVFVGYNGGTGTLNIGEGAAVGVVDADSIAMSGVSTINFNHNEANYSFGAEIIDHPHAAPTSGAVNFLGTGTTTLTAVNTYTSATNINAGRLVIAEGASIANSSLTTVNDKATLAGAGTVGDVSVKAGGTIVPTALKTLTVKGITFADGSTYQVAVNAGGETSLIAADTAALNGTVRVNAGSGNYAVGTNYTILTTTNAAGVTGTFDNTVVSDFAFLNAALTYDPNKVNLALTRNTASFASVGLTANQRSVGRGLNSADVTNPVYGAVVQQNAAGARQAFDALSGEAHASNKAALVSNALLISDTIGRRATDPRDKAAAPVRAWAQGFGNWMDRGSDGNAATMESTTGGFVSGIDATISSWRLGAAAGYSQTDTDVSARSSSLETDSYHLSIYGATRQGPYNILVGGVYSWNDISSERNVAFSGFSDALSGSYNANTAQVFAEANVRFPLGSAIIEPFAGFSYINHETDAFHETGGAAALRVAGDDFGVSFTTVGFRPSIALGQGLGFGVTGRGTVAWRHAFGDVDTLVDASLAGSSSFQVAGVPITEDALLLEAGIDVDVARNASVGLSWSGQFGDEATDNQLKGQILYRW